ncbi:MAG: transglycosylase family protein [Ferrimicrobium sp.]
MTEYRSRRVSALIALASTLTIVVLGFALEPVASASPGQSALQAQASTLAGSIALESNQIHTLAIQENAANTALISAQQQLAATKVQLAADQARIVAAKRLLITFAVSRFTQSFSSSTTLSALRSSQADIIAQSEFEQVAGGYIDGTIAQYYQALGGQSRELQLQQAQESVAAAAQAQIRVSQANLDATVSKEQTSLASVNSQISQLVQAQLAAQAAAQQAAAQQALFQRRAAAQLAVTQGAPSSSGVASVASGAAGVSNWGGVPAPPSAAAFAALRQCEASGNYQTNTGNGYYGAYQFSQSTWLDLGESGLPSNAAPSVQDQAARMEQSQAGWGAWPECSMILGLS